MILLRWFYDYILSVVENPKIKGNFDLQAGTSIRYEQIYDTQAKA